MLRIGHNPICVVLSSMTLGSNFVSLFFETKVKLKRKKREVCVYTSYAKTLILCINVVTNVKIANSYDTTNTIQRFSCF